MKCPSVLKKVSLILKASIVGEMKMGNIAPRGGIEPTTLAFWTGVLNIIPLWNCKCFKWFELISLFITDNYIHTGTALTQGS